MQSILQFDALHVVSDLHLGGFDDRKIFGMPAELVRLLDYARDQALQQHVGFVINGDFVDFLAAKDARYFDPEGATDKLERVVNDATFNPVFKALQRFATAPKARLIVNLGNHDLEFALPWVAESLLKHLSNGDASARGRISLELTGAGVLCSVGNAKVLCVHGNEVDAWNVTDYEALRRIGRDAQHGLPSAPWIPNAGTKLVIEVMNEIKRGKYPFVDLLKPETEGVVPALLALEPSLVSRIPSIAPVGLRLMRDKLRRATGFLGAEQDGFGEPAIEPVAAGAMPVRQKRLQDERQRNARALLDVAENSLAAGESPMDLLDVDGEVRTLGTASALRKRLLTGDAAEALREAMQPLAKDRSFSPFEPDETYRELDSKIAPDIDILIAGHTHLERVLPRRNSRGIYFNTGTWARLVQISEADVQSTQAFKRFHDAFTAGTMQALDQAGVVVKRPTFVSVWSDNGAARAELRRVLPGTGDVFAPATGDARGTYSKG